MKPTKEQIESLKGIYKQLTDEQKEKLKTCKDMDAFMQLAGEWGIELPDEMVDAVAGGIDWEKLARKVIDAGEVL